jgi:hypothetical protein
MGFPVAGMLAFNTAEFFHIRKGRSIKSIERAEGVDSILGVAGIINVIVQGMPRFPLRLGFLKHDGVEGRIHFGESGRASPVAGGSPDHRMHIHAGDDGAGSARVGNFDRLSVGGFQFYKILRISGRGVSQTRFQIVGL